MAYPRSTGYRLLDAFKALFEGTPYNPRSSTQGDRIALELYEDVLARARSRDGSARYDQRVSSASRVVNPKHKLVGLTRIQRRRGDGTFGEILHGAVPVTEPGYSVQRSSNSTIEIGCEVKILCTAIQRQTTRVINDLKEQVVEFQKNSGSRPPITVGIAGVNHAEIYRSLIRKAGVVCANCGAHNALSQLTTGRGQLRHPCQEAPRAVARLTSEAMSSYDHFLLIEFEASNIAPYPFAWVNESRLIAEYNTLLTNLAAEYENRFP